MPNAPAPINHGAIMPVSGCARPVCFSLSDRQLTAINCHFISIFFFRGGGCTAFNHTGTEAIWHAAMLWLIPDIWLWDFTSSAEKDKRAATFTFLFFFPFLWRRTTGNKSCHCAEMHKKGYNWLSHYSRLKISKKYSLCLVIFFLKKNIFFPVVKAYFYPVYD